MFTISIGDLFMIYLEDLRKISIGDLCTISLRDLYTISQGYLCTLSLGDFCEIKRHQVLPGADFTDQLSSCINRTSLSEASLVVGEKVMPALTDFISGRSHETVCL